MQEEILQIGNDISDLKIFEIINKYFHKNYTGWMRAWYDINDEYAAWFPIIYANGEKPHGNYGGARNWSNTLSSDGQVITAINFDVDTDPNDDGRGYSEDSDKYNMKKRLVFGRIKGSFQFLGVFHGSDRLWRQSHPTFIHKRIAIGLNLSTFELIKEPQSTGDINTAVSPKKVIDEVGVIRYMCPRCDYVFKKAERCPECGQLIDE